MLKRIFDKHRLLVVVSFWFVFVFLFFSGVLDRNWHLGGRYYLLNVDMQSFFLQEGRHSESPSEILTEAIYEIGWNSRYIVMKRWSTWHGKYEWVVADVEKNILLGPFEDKESIAIEEVRSIDLMPPEVAMDKIGKVGRFFGWVVGIGFLCLIWMYIGKVLAWARILPESVGAKIHAVKEKFVLLWGLIVSMWLVVGYMGW